MKAEYDFSRGKRGPALQVRGKTLINEALAHRPPTTERPATASEVRKIVREELAAAD